MKSCTKFYIDGQWVEPHGTRVLDVINPATERPLGSIGLGDAVVDGEPGLNYLCAGLKRFFAHAVPTAKRMAARLQSNSQHA